MNCTLERRWSTGHVTLCLSDPWQLVGLSVGILATVLWSVGHVCLYRFKRMRTRQRSVRLFLAMNWFSDALGCLGAGLAQQLVSQLVFGATVTLVHTLCCFHSFIFTANKPSEPRSKRDRMQNKLHLSKRSLLRTCICPLNAIFISTTVIVFTVHGFIKETKRTTDLELSDVKTWMPVEWLVGYVFGSMAGVIHCCAKMLDVLDSYISVEFGSGMAVAYGVSILGELGYVGSVLSQKAVLPSFQHALPWVLPRLVAAGIDAGILVQRIRQKRRGKRRKISEEDADCLLSSSESGHEWLSDDSEEVIWVPLKNVDSAIPTHPVCTSRVQILPESDKSFDTVDWNEEKDDLDVKGNTEPEESCDDSLQGHSETADLNMGSHSETADITMGSHSEADDVDRETETPQNTNDDHKDAATQEVELQNDINKNFKESVVINNNIRIEIEMQESSKSN